MKLWRRIYRLALLAPYLALGLMLSALHGSAVPQGLPSPRLQDITRRWFVGLCRILGLRISVRGEPAAAPVLLVANHISWLDIPLIGSLTEVGFVSKAEVAAWPVAGWLARRTGTLFIERGGRDAANRTAEQMTWHLKRGRRILFFPEATTTDGREVRRFHPRLFAAAQLSGCAVQPLALRYPAIDGRASPAPFIGDDRLLPHALRILGEKYLPVEVHFGRVIAAAGDRRALSEAAHDDVRALLDGNDPRTLPQRSDSA
ncbi:MAG: lysophospholipid acyltransferase family protein [Chromatiales bacterium]|jgi:1-acyl-sn-glycerol-3-phosphate acyltransferase|nr:lysophospholipid acyltransferase family protein [Chromatiales bacterium]MDX9767077.1 lysophospholipid acyltransferase family protein [Ectothiorhodospiraceae bacterium]